MNVIPINNQNGFHNVSVIRFDLVNIETLSVKINNIVINDQLAVTSKFHITSLLIISSIAMFVILPRANKKLGNFIRAYISFFAFIVCSAINHGTINYVYKILTICFFGMFLFETDNEPKVKFEKIALLSFGTILSASMLIHGKLSGQYEALNILCVCTLIVIYIIYFVKEFNSFNIKKWLCENQTILFIILCFALLSSEVINSWLMWDASLYYTSLINAVTNFNADFSGIYKLYLCGHASLGYSLWLIFFQLLKNGTALAQIADIILAGISIYAYYQILRKILGTKHSNKLLALATLPYAFSPFVLGIIGNLNLDSATMYFALIFVACSLYHYDCLELIFAFLFCFTKESAIIYYITFIIAKVICEYMLENRFSLYKLIIFGIGNIRNYVYALPTILWLALYKLNVNGGWHGIGSTPETKWDYFGFNIDIIIVKLKQIFFLNFNWIFWIIIFITIFVLHNKKVKADKEAAKILIPLSVMGISVVVFGCSYVTYVLARYITPLIFIVYMIATWLIGQFKKKWFGSFNIIVSTLFLIQCFRTIDPLTQCIFPSIQTSCDQKICAVGDAVRFSDHIVYNRQYIYWSEILVTVLEQAGYDGDMLIVFPNAICNQRQLLGSWECTWDTRAHKLDYYDENAVSSEKSRLVISSSDTSNILEELSEIHSNYILYIIPNWATMNENFIADKEIIRQGKLTFKGYSVQYMTLKMPYITN